MATLIKTNGTQIEVIPENGKKFSNQERWRYIGGWYQLIFLPGKKVMLVDEEGDPKGLLLNFKASKMCGFAIVGDVMVCDRKEL